MHLICTNLSLFAEYFVISPNMDVACIVITKSMKTFHDYCHKCLGNYLDYFCYISYTLINGELCDNNS